MVSPTTLPADVRASVSDKPVLRTRDLIRAGLHPEQIRRYAQSGELEKVARGQYVIPGATLPDDMGLVMVATASPTAVVCLLTALRVHQIGTQAPSEIWIAIDRRTAKPRIDYPPTRVVRFSGAAYSFGIEIRDFGGVPVRLYSAAKTVADCFKYRNKIGLDIAVEALRDGLNRRLFTRDSLWEAACVCRVSRVMRPYLEAVQDA